MRVLPALLVPFFLLAAPANAQTAQPQTPRPPLATAAISQSEIPAPGGDVRIPLADYTRLLNRLASGPRRPPAAWALGEADVSVRINETGARKTAVVDVTVKVQTFDDEWALVPLLPPGTALRRATVDGKPVQLVEQPGGLAWSTNKAGTFTVGLGYSVDVQRTDSGFVLPLSVPRAAATTLEVTVPEAGLDLSAVPSADAQTTHRDGVTYLRASVPATPLIVVSWRADGAVPFAIARAGYDGELRGGALVWTGTFEVELFAGGRVTLPVMPRGTTLSDVRVDGVPATVFEVDGFFATRLQGRGSHRIEVTFQTPVINGDGPPRASLRIPRVPVSRFDLALPGRKAVSVNPGAGVTIRRAEGKTLATVFIPLSGRVDFSWATAAPDDRGGQVRAAASLYHTVHAEEGVLYATGFVAYEIARGEVDLLVLEMPAAAQVNRITAPAGGIADWVVTDSEAAERKRIEVFLARPVGGEYLIRVEYEQLLGAAFSPEGGPDGVDAAIAVPLLSAGNVARQRGMVALLSSPELSLEPTEETGVSRVGENQLPSFVAGGLTMTVAHTFKYIAPSPVLRVNAVAPERKQGRFDAQIDTLVSLGDVTLKGAATVTIDVKAGALPALRLDLPANINVLAVSAPSLRNYDVVAPDPGRPGGGQAIDLQFTREMSGRFRIEVLYERIMDRAAAETAVPTLSATGAEVEHGRIAIEALTAVEVRPGTVERLSSLDINELPRQLVLKTTNPILLAYRYVNARPPIRLALKITRHREIDVQVAAIERAVYKSLVTRDGLAVTTARLTVRNSRRQFLRLALPPGSQVWSVFVDGKPEKPAYATDEAMVDADRTDGATAAPSAAVLIKMINSARGFPVEVVFATLVQPIDGVGVVSSVLPRPDMVVTHSRWDVLLPAGPTYRALDSEMDLRIAGRPVDPRRIERATFNRAADAAAIRMGQPLRIDVPTQGVLFAYEKLYADQSPEAAGFVIRYVVQEFSRVALAASAFGALVLWLGIAGLAGRLSLSRRASAGALGGSVVVLAATIGYLGSSPVPAAALSLAVAALWGAAALATRWRDRRAERQAGVPG